MNTIQSQKKKYNNKKKLNKKKADTKSAEKHSECGTILRYGKCVLGTFKIDSCILYSM